MENTPKETSQANPPALPEWVGEEIFKHMENLYAAKWIDSLGGIPRERVKTAWREELIGYTPREIKRGMSECRNRVWPPTLPEFLQLCRPPADPRKDWAEACEQMRVRLKGQGGDVWSRPQVYWAAVKIGNFDLQSVAWEQIRARWENALAEAKADPIPPYVAAIPAPGKTTTTREEAAKRLHEIAEKTGVSAIDKCEPNTRWAVRLAEREAGGEEMSIIQKRLWRDALGVTMATSAKDALAQMERAA